LKTHADPSGSAKRKEYLRYRLFRNLGQRKSAAPATMDLVPLMAPLQTPKIYELRAGARDAGRKQGFRCIHDYV